MSNLQNIKEQLLKEIEDLSAKEQQSILGIVENYVYGKVDETEWKQLPAAWKKRINETLQQAESGNFVLHEDAVKYISKKYGLNG